MDNGQYHKTSTVMEMYHRTVAPSHLPSPHKRMSEWKAITTTTFLSNVINLRFIHVLQKVCGFVGILSNWNLNPIEQKKWQKQVFEMQLCTHFWNMTLMCAIEAWQVLFTDIFHRECHYLMCLDCCVVLPTEFTIPRLIILLLWNVWIVSLDFIGSI